MRKYTRIFSVMAALLMLILAVSLVNAQDEGEKVLNYSFGPGDIPSLDPSLGTDTSSIQVVIEIFPGLTRLNEQTLELEPGMATWEVADDDVTYTFSIAEEVPWVSYNPETEAFEEVTDDEGNVRYVTAEDFRFGMLRSMDPRTGSYYGGVLADWVAGGEEYNGSINDMAEDASDEELAEAISAAEEGVEITAVDDYTLEIVADEAAAFIPNVYGMWMATAQPSWLIDEFGDLWTEAENIATYGPYGVSEWLHGESLTMLKNSMWEGTEGIPVAEIDRIYSTMLEASAQLANYEAGTLDISDVPSADVERIQADPNYEDEYTINPGTCTYYYGFNTAKPPFDDLRIRRAFSMAIDRQAIIDNILKAGQSPAYFFSRPNLVAAPTAEEYPDFVIGEDMEEAQALFDEYMAENEEFPEFVLMHNQSETHSLIAQAVANMWVEAFGIDESKINIQTQEWAVYLETTKDDETAPPVFRLAWCLDYPDTHNFLYDVWHSSVINNGVSWTNEEFDSLTEQAKSETDTAVREELYAQAENILTNEDAVMAPIYYYTSSSLTKPYVERTYSLIGNQYFEKWDIDMSAK